MRNVLPIDRRRILCDYTLYVVEREKYDHNCQTTTKHLVTKRSLKCGKEERSLTRFLYQIYLLFTVRFSKKKMCWSGSFGILYENETARELKCSSVIYAKHCAYSNSIVWRILSHKDEFYAACVHASYIIHYMCLYAKCV